MKTPVRCKRCNHKASEVVYTRSFGREELCSPCAINVRIDKQEITLWEAANNGAGPRMWFLLTRQSKSPIATHLRDKRGRIRRFPSLLAAQKKAALLRPLTEREKAAIAWAKGNYRQWRRRFGETRMEHAAKILKGFTQEGWDNMYFYPFGVPWLNENVKIIRELFAEGCI